MKASEECTSFEDVEEQIDLVDHNIVALIAKRVEYVRARSQFSPQKTTDGPNRIKKKLEICRGWAENYRLDPDQVESIFMSLVGFFNASEMTSPAEQEDDLRSTSFDPSSLL